MSNSNLIQHRASIGIFYCKACRIPEGKCVITTPSLTIPFLLICKNGFNAINLAFTIYILVEMHIQSYNPTLKNACCDVKHNPNRTHNATSKSSMSNCKFESLLVLFVTTFLLLMLSNDIEPNPGPVTSTTIRELSIIHLNAGSMRNKMDVISIETSKYDIITLSETWLTDTIENDEISLPGFSQPFRLDRNGHGGVAIYVKSDIICKPREDLHVDGLEAIWIEFREKGNTILISLSV